MVKQVTAERRTWVRAKRVLSIQFRFVKGISHESKHIWHLSTTQDMSMGGLAFYTDREYHAGDLLEVKVVMSGLLDIFNGQAQVVRVEKKRTGAYFFTAIRFVESKIKKRKAKVYLSSKRPVRRSAKRII